MINRYYMDSQAIDYQEVNGSSPSCRLPVLHLAPSHTNTQVNRHKSAQANIVPKAGAMDVMPTWTLDQIAGLVFGVSAKCMHADMAL